MTQLLLFRRRPSGGWSTWKGSGSGAARRARKPRPAWRSDKAWVECAELRALWEARPNRDLTLAGFSAAMYPSSLGSTSVARRLFGESIDARYGGRPQRRVRAQTAARAVRVMGYDPVDVGL